MMTILHLASSVIFLVRFLTGFHTAHAEYVHHSSRPVDVAKSQCSPFICNWLHIKNEMCNLPLAHSHILFEYVRD